MGTKAYLPPGAEDWSKPNLNFGEENITYDAAKQSKADDKSGDSFTQRFQEMLDSYTYDPSKTPYIESMINATLTAMMGRPPKRQAAKPFQMETDVDTSAERRALAESRRQAFNAIDNSSVMGSMNAAAKAKTQSDYYKNIRSIKNQERQQEQQLRQQQDMANYQTELQRVQNLNEYNMNLFGRREAQRTEASQNVANLAEKSMLQKKQYNQNEADKLKMAALAASDSEVFRHFINQDVFKNLFSNKTKTGN